MPVSKPTQPSFRVIPKPPSLSVLLPSLPSIPDLVLPTMTLEPTVMPVFSGEMPRYSDAGSIPFTASTDNITSGFLQSAEEAIANSKARVFETGLNKIKFDLAKKKYADGMRKYLSQNAKRKMCFMPGDVRFEVDSAIRQAREELSAEFMGMSFDAIKSNADMMASISKEAEAAEKALAYAHADIEGAKLKIAVTKARQAVSLVGEVARAYSSQIEAYKRNVQAYEASLSESLFEIEEWITNLESQKISGERSLMENRAALALASMKVAEAEIVRAELEAEIANHELSILKAKSFYADVQEYMSKIKTKTVDHQVYSSLVDAEMAAYSEYIERLSVAEEKMRATRAMLSAQSSVGSSNVETASAVLREGDVSLDLAQQTLSIKKQELEDQIREYDMIVSEYVKRLSSWESGWSEYFEGYLRNADTSTYGTLEANKDKEVGYTNRRYSAESSLLKKLSDDRLSLERHRASVTSNVDVAAELVHTLA